MPAFSAFSMKPESSRSAHSPSISGSSPSFTFISSSRRSMCCLARRSENFSPLSRWSADTKAPSPKSGDSVCSHPVPTCLSSPSFSLFDSDWRLGRKVPLRYELNADASAARGNPLFSEIAFASASPRSAFFTVFSSIACPFMPLMRSARLCASSTIKSMLESWHFAFAHSISSISGSNTYV